MTIKPLNTTLPPGRVSLAPPSRRPDVQGLRAVAVLLVVAFHAGLPVPGGFVGVDVFFVISGFVITSMLHRELLETGRIGLAHFYIRRFKRLTPALALMVAVVMAASVLILSPIESQGNAALTALGAIFLVANVVIARTTGNYFDADADTNPLLHTWSLSVEEQFYLIFPVMLLIGWRLGSRYRRATAVSGVAIGIGGAISLALALGEAKGVGFTALPESLIGFYGPATRAWEFAAGVLLALGARRLTTLSTSLSLAMSGVGAALLCGSLWLISDATPFPGPWTLVPVCGTLLLIAAGPGNGPITSRLSFVCLGRATDTDPPEPPGRQTGPPRCRRHRATAGVGGHRGLPGEQGLLERHNSAVPELDRDSARGLCGWLCRGRLAKAGPVHVEWPGPWSTHLPGGRFTGRSL